MSQLPLLARRGVCNEAADGVVDIKLDSQNPSMKNNHPVRSNKRKLRDIFLMSRPPLLARRGNSDI
jgi:hypothetical protein